MKRHLLSIAIALAAAGVLLPAAASAREIYITVAPPEARYEVVPAQRHGYFWAPGYWEWHGRHHVWIAGHWVRERRGHVWREPRWEQEGERWHYRAGYWERRDR